VKSLERCRLYAFVDLAYLSGRSSVVVARELCEGGADLIQLRAKNAPVQEVRRLAEELLPVAEKADVGLVINDYPEVASAIGAPLCHLGQEDFFDAGHAHVNDVRSRLPGSAVGARDLKFGLSTHAPEQAERAVRAGADYVAIGPVFPTPTKPTARAVTLDYVRWAAAHLSIPWFAIGGITLENLDRVLEAGATRVCVVSAILRAPNVVRACQTFRDRLLSAGRNDLNKS
jgi:thiamine-phosphate pyrophosphorylase